MIVSERDMYLRFEAWKVVFSAEGQTAYQTFKTSDLKTFITSDGKVFKVRSS